MNEANLYSNNSGQVSGSWDLSELQSSVTTRTGEEAGDLDSKDELASRMIRTGEEALVNSSQKGHEMADAWKAELDKLKKVGVAHTCSIRKWVWHTHIASGSGCGTCI